MGLFYKNENEEEEIEIGKLWGDGLVISTAYGSVSRSMVLNGPIIHKKLESLILTPVCPLSLKFRPIVLPINCNIIIKIDEHSRAEGSVYIDGINTKMSIKPG
jgi:NADH kinase